MNQYLTTLLNAVAIDLDHLTDEYLSSDELAYIDKVLTSKQDFEKCFHTYEYGCRLEVLLQFLNAHKKEIIDLMEDEGEGKIETLKELYTSGTISGDYDCFRFDLSKFPQCYKPKNQVLTLYRVGREGESEGNLGCSWAKTIEGLKAYCCASGISESMLEYRPVFCMEINDSQVLFEVNKTEHELVLKHDFKPNKLCNLDRKRLNQISC